MIAGVLLAAGRSSRFRGDKLLVPLADGRPMVLTSLAALTAALKTVVVVVRPRQRQLLTLLHEAPDIAGAEMEVIVRSCTQAEHGMGHSIACGIAASEQAEGWIIALADMPRVRARTIGRLRDALAAGAHLAAPTHGGRRGNPVGFSSAYRDELLALRGDRGARGIVERDHALVKSLECEDPGVLRDVDMPEDLHTLR